MNSILICLFAIFAICAAEDVHKIWVGCDNSNRPSHYEFYEFGLAVNEANLHLNSRIHVCCFIPVGNPDFLNDGPEIYGFNHNVELIGSFPEKGYSCFSSKVHHIAQTRLPQADCKSSECLQANSRILQAEVDSNDWDDFPLAWFWSYGSVFGFGQKAKVERLGFLAYVPEDFNSTIDEVKEAIAKRPATLNKNFGNFFDDEFANTFIGSTPDGDYSRDLIIDGCFFGATEEALAFDFENEVPFFTWTVGAISQQLRIKDSFIASRDFHLLLRFARDVHVEDSFLIFHWSLVLDFLYGDASDVTLPDIDPQIEFSIKDTSLLYIGLDPIFFQMPADMGIVPLIEDEILPEIIRIKLHNVFWFNLDRLIGVGSYDLFEEIGFQEQFTDIHDDFVLLVGFTDPF